MKKLLVILFSLFVVSLASCTYFNIDSHTLFVERDSYAHEYALKNNIKYTIID